MSPFCFEYPKISQATWRVPGLASAKFFSFGPAISLLIAIRKANSTTGTTNTGTHTNGKWDTATLGWPKANGWDRGWCRKHRIDDNGEQQPEARENSDHHGHVSIILLCVQCR
jgi:hypothetical protein